MTLTDSDREQMDAFIAYIEDSVASDDRYGPVQRPDGSDRSILTTRFMEGRKCWFEVSIRAAENRIRVGFFSTDPSINDDCEQAIAESGATAGRFVGDAFAEIGLDWPEPPVEHGREGDAAFFATTLPYDGPTDLETDLLRDKTILVLEGFLLAFGPVLGAEEGDD